MKLPSITLGLLLACTAPGWAADSSSTTQRIDQLEQEIEALKQEINKESEAEKAEETEEKSEDGIKVGGAVRFQYSFEDYNAGNRDRGGDIDFDTFRIDVNGSIGDVSFSVQYRWYQYMDVVHHAYVGYQ